jgi:hypothetical protein
VSARGTLLPALLLVVGIAMVIRTAIAGAVIGVVLGLLFCALGVGRLYLEHRG